MTQYFLSKRPAGVRYNVATTVELIDGRIPPFDAIQPGDVIALDAGTHHPKTIRNLTGTAENPILIINSGGLVEFTDDSHENAITFKSCEYVQLSGDGSSGTTYGIQFTRFYSKAILLTCKTRNIEIDHIKIMEGTASTCMGIHLLNYGLPAAYVNSYQWDAFDYDGDGTPDADDEVDGRYWTSGDLTIRDCHFDGTSGVRNLDVPIYVGYSNYTETPHQRDLYDAEHNLDLGVTVYFPPGDNAEVYNCIFEHTTMKCCQVGSYTESVKVHDNTFSDVCSQVAEHDPAISINPGCDNVEIYNNKFIDLNNGLGLYSYGETVKVYNNLIVNPGYYGMILGALKPAGYHHYDSAWILNNTIVSTYAAHCIAFANSEGTDDRVQNNLLINTNAAYISGTLDVNSNNYTNADPANAKFTDAANGDYTLAADSPCLNVGANLAAYGVTDDLLGTARPQGAAYDQGAYERSV